MSAERARYSILCAMELITQARMQLVPLGADLKTISDAVDFLGMLNGKLAEQHNALYSNPITHERFCDDGPGKTERDSATRGQVGTGQGDGPTLDAGRSERGRPEGWSEGVTGS